MGTISLKTNKEPSKDGNRCTVCLHTCDCPAVKQFGLNFMNRLHEMAVDRLRKVAKKKKVVAGHVSHRCGVMAADMSATLIQNLKDPTAQQRKKSKKQSAYCSYCRKYYIAGRRHSCVVHSQPPMPPAVKSD
jgi:hypothetical protein